MKKTFLGICIAFGAISCGQSTPTLTLQDYYSALEDQGIRVTDKSEKWSSMVGAVDGESFTADGSLCEVYEYDLETTSGEKSLTNLKENGFFGAAFPEIHKNLAVHCSGKGEGAKTAYAVLKSL